LACRLPSRCRGPDSDCRERAESPGGPHRRSWSGAHAPRRFGARFLARHHDCGPCRDGYESHLGCAPPDDWKLNVIAQDRKCSPRDSAWKYLRQRGYGHLRFAACRGRRLSERCKKMTIGKSAARSSRRNVGARPKPMCRQKLRNEVPEAVKPALSCHPWLVSGRAGVQSQLSTTIFCNFSLMSISFLSALTAGRFRPSMRTLLAFSRRGPCIPSAFSTRLSHALHQVRKQGYPSSRALSSRTTAARSPDLSRLTKIATAIA
jgi:hypothetical protein